MQPMTLVQVRTAVRGRPAKALFSDEGTAHRLPNLSVRRVTTDTRQLQAGDLFFALAGETFDAHDFLADAKAKGAVCAIVHRVPEHVPEDLPLILVDDTRRALGYLANAHRRTLRHTRVIGVAGSNGKTGTKHLIHAALSAKLKGTMSPKSFNNDVGVPITLLPAEASDDFVVVEMGTNHLGEIKQLSSIAEPDIAVITNCSIEHLAGLGDLDGVRGENASITYAMNERGFLVVNGDDPKLVQAVFKFAGKKVTFGFEKHNDLWAADIRTGRDGTRFKVNGGRQEVFVPMVGRHVAVNALAAIAVARRMLLSDEQIVAGLAQCTGPEMRLQMEDIGGVLLLNDAYNANPASMAAALDTLSQLECAGRKLAVLGTMLELGDGSDGFHVEAGRQAAAARPDLLVCVGPSGAILAEAAKEAGLPASCIFVEADSADAAKRVVPTLKAGDLVLLKGSRGMKLETVAGAMRAGASAEPRRMAS